ncbi:MAG TPA: hypothetical protein VFH06_05415 [Candidatus Saccharimonadales bacterium]|nr:hypothetical protein [Candidatus Saccharimonadales bacterium]
MDLEERTIKDTIGKIDVLVQETEVDSMQVTASKIVNLIWSNNVIRPSTLETQRYSELNAIADLAADIELEREDDEHRELWRTLVINLDIMKEKLE